MLIENLVIIPLALGLAESDGRKDSRRFTNILVYVSPQADPRNPMVLAIPVVRRGPPRRRACICLNPLLRAIDLLANASSAAALFGVGGALAGLGAERGRRRRRTDRRRKTPACTRC